jgi:hypothetical protein
VGIKVVGFNVGSVEGFFEGRTVGSDDGFSNEGIRDGR